MSKKTFFRYFFDAIGVFQEKLTAEIRKKIKNLIAFNLLKYIILVHINDLKPFFIEKMVAMEK